MPGRTNGPLAGPVLGIRWDRMAVGKPVLYGGSANGAKANASRAGKRYAGKKFRSFKNATGIYVERIK